MKRIALIISLLLIPIPLLAGQNQKMCTVSYNGSTGTTVLHTIGVGFEPKRQNLSVTQKRLLARRAAVIHGYKNLFNAAAHFPEPHAQFPFRVEMTSGFLKGVEVEQARFFSDGKVEVDMHLVLDGNPVSFQQVKEVFIQQSFPVYEMNQERKAISKEEYENLFRQ